MPAGLLTAQLVMDVCGARPYTTVRLVVSARRVGGVGGGVGGGGGGPGFGGGGSGGGDGGGFGLFRAALKNMPLRQI